MGKGQREQAEQRRKKRRQRIVVFIAVGATMIAAVLATIVIPHVSDLRAFRREQAAMPDLSPFDAYWLEANPDYVGWLMMDGTSIDFPVVRGDDNEKYMTTSFSGEENMLGAVFMDYRVTGESQHIIIYGHQASDVQGNWLVFGALHEFLDDAHLAQNPIIMFMQNDSIYEFEIFSARRTDIHDPAYQLDFSALDSWTAFLERNSAPTDAKQIITLSTCVGVDNDMRMIVQGALWRIVPITTEKDENGSWKIVRPE
jgi:sortase B